ncbi:hypothetical protein EDB80DRAFT_836100 [Ilyonectria destructans]|nr:hypothetical protein EDB80DRAFT_836100 [Ilyonectria destructans]
MSPPFIYCVACGCPFEIPPGDEYADSEDETWVTQDPSEDPSKQWLCDIRLFGTAAHVQRLYPRHEINNESNVKGLFISGPAYWSFTEGRDFRTNDRGADSFRVLSLDKDTGDGLFPLHDRCLSILRHAITWRVEFGRQPPSPSLSLMGVYKFLCSQRKRNLAEMYRIADQGGINGTSSYASYGLEFDHDYYGARRFWTYQGWEVCAANEWFCNDPVNVPGLPDFISALLGEISSEQASTPDNSPDSADTADAGTATAGPRTGVETLPLEILNYVTRFLSASSVVRLQRCSKTLSRRIVLDGQFWRTQLLNGCTAPYLYRLGGGDMDANTAQIAQLGVLGCWEGLARKLGAIDEIIEAKEPALISAPWGLRNRCRLWAICNHLITSSLE